MFLSFVPLVVTQAPAGSGPALPASTGSNSLPGELAWIDHDGDGRLDALAVTPGGRLRLLASRAEAGFEDETERLGLAAIDAVTLVRWADYDGDGRGDLFVGRGSGASLLLRNEGGGFVDVAAGTGLLIEEPVQDAHWLDEDGDGRLDLHVVTSASNRIWRGLEGGFFDSVELPLEAIAPAPAIRSGSPWGAGAPEVEREVEAPASESPPSRTDGARNLPSAGGAPGPLAGAPALSGGATPIAGFPIGCATSLRDQATPGACLEASSAATLGMLYPLSNRLFVDEATGNVGIGTTSPGYALQVIGKAVSGVLNTAAGEHATVSGGENNDADGKWSTAAGGIANQASSVAATISGGSSNHVGGSFANSIGGGFANSAGSGDHSGGNTIGGGYYNGAGAGTYSFGNVVAGGSYNSAGVDDHSNSNTIGGGRDNRAGGVGIHGATIPGGAFNRAAGNYSFAAGRSAKANHTGAFVWGDARSGDKTSSAADEFNVYADGGVRLFAEGLAGPSLVVDSAGNVGIGTVAPTQRLHVEGQLVAGTGSSASGLHSSVAGGQSNTCGGGLSFVGGGFENSVLGGTASGVIAGGYRNHIAGDAAQGTVIGGGQENEAGGNYALQNTVAGGRGNVASGYNSAWNTVGGGQGNRAGGTVVVGATVPGGLQNSAEAAYSFAAGRRAKALHSGSFVWGDGQDLDKPSSAADQFNVYAEGGMRVFAQGAVKPTLVVDAAGKMGVGTSAPAFTLEVDGTAGKPGGGSWSVSSDARLKKDVATLAGALETLLALRGVSFEYIDPAAIGELEGRRIGFIAQEVERVLPDWVGEKEDGTKYLTIRGFEALAVEALRELRAEIVARDARIAALEARLELLENTSSAVAALGARLAALEHPGDPVPRPR
jgi:hypothetical protein